MPALVIWTLAALDSISTYVVIRMGGTEVNPLLNAMIAHSGLGLTMTVRAVAAGAIGSFIYSKGRIWQQRAVMVILSGIVWWHWLVWTVYIVGDSAFASNAITILRRIQ